MSLAERLPHLDRDLDALGNVPADLSERAGVQWARQVALAAVDDELDALSTGVSFVSSRPLSVAPPSALVSIAPSEQARAEAPAFVGADAVAEIESAVLSGAPAARISILPMPPQTQASAMPLASELATPRVPSMAPANVESVQSLTPELSVENAPPFSDFPAPIVETSSAASTAQARDMAIDEPFVPTLPSEPPPEVETTVGLGSKRRTLTMSEPPLSSPPVFDSAPPGPDVDPFDGQPPAVVPPRAPSVWPMAPAPKRNTSKTLRTSAAPPPPPAAASMRPRVPSPHPFDAPVRRPSDTPDPFAPLNRASSRPASGLDADELFGGISSAPPAPAVPKMTAPPPLRAATKTVRQQAPVIPPQPKAADDFELLVEDEMLEIDVEEMDELD